MNTALASPSLPLLLARQACETPRFPALVFKDITISYQELNHRANAVANFLQEQGVSRQTRVGLAMRRGEDPLETLVLLFGILKVAVYVPILLPPAAEQFPVERLKFMVSDASISLILTHRRFEKQLSRVSVSSDARLFSMDELQEELARASTENPPPPDPDDLAYILYTTGTSTGQPKGVMVEHSSLGHFAHVQNEMFSIRPGDRVMQFFSLNFDASLAELVTLGAGATLYPVSAEALYSPQVLAQFLQERAITVAFLTPTIWEKLPPVNLPALRLMVMGGEAVPASLVARWWKLERRLVNEFGLTETTVCCSLGDCLNDGAPPSIGQALPGIEISIRDEHLTPLPPATPGEICVSGLCLARGYTNPQLTRQRFVADPADSQRRIFLTHDRGVMDESGTIFFLERMDQTRRVKLPGGLLVELDAIEALLLQHPAVRECAVEAYQGRLVAFLSLQPDYIVGQRGGDLTEQTAATEQATIRALQRHLEEHVFAYMLPKAYVVLDDLPHNESDKLDRKALLNIPVPWHEFVSSDSFVAAWTAIERGLGEIIADIRNDVAEQLSVMAKLFFADSDENQEEQSFPAGDTAISWEQVNMMQSAYQYGIDSLQFEDFLLRVYATFRVDISATEINTPLFLLANVIEYLQAQPGGKEVEKVGTAVRFERE